MPTQAELASDACYEGLLDYAALNRVDMNHELFLQVIEGKDLTHYITQSDALRVLGDTLDASQIASLITFDNSHLVAHALLLNKKAAKALYEELKQWRKSGKL